MTERDDAPDGNPEVENAPIDVTRTRVTREVGSEGGSPGNVEVGVDLGAGEGSEASETLRPAESDEPTVVHDRTGVGRRDP